MARLHLSVVCIVLHTLVAPSLAGDSDMLQDVCVAYLASPIKLNGFLCKVNITADDFFFAGLKKAGNTSNMAGSAVTAANMLSFPGVNTLGVSSGGGRKNNPHRRGRVRPPRGLVHFQQNRGYGPASVIAAFNTQLQGMQVIANTLFAAVPPVPTDVLAKAFRIDNDSIEGVKALFK
ncbi:unnamed protein product [Alopecurus aequalis]